MYREDYGTPAGVAPAGSTRAGGYKRPQLKDDVLRPGSERRVPKPRALIEIVDAGNERLGLADRKLLNILLATSWPDLGRNAAGPFEAPASLLRRAIGQGGRTDNQRLRRSLDRLKGIPVSYERLPADGDLLATAPILKTACVAQGGRDVTWTFGDRLLPELHTPSVWAELDLEVSAKLKSRHALVLYEHIKLKSGLKWPVWQITADQLRGYLGLRDRLPGWHDFKRVVDGALKEIARCTDLPLTCTAKPERRTGGIFEFRIGRRSLTPTSHRPDQR